MFNILNKILGDSNEKALGKLNPILEKVNDLEGKFSLLSEIELKEYTEKLKVDLGNGSSLDEILPEAFSLVREAAKRVLGMRHFDVQIIGGIILHQGKISEMRTGEGKTLVATLPTFLNALSGDGVHLITVNDYLAKRDAEWMGKIYQFLGLSIGCLQNNKSLILISDDKNINDMKIEGSFYICSRKEAYECDITYGTNNEFGFDYLRDNMIDNYEQKVQKSRNFAIVDEVDNILIDEARTPLIISGPAKEQTGEYKRFSKLAKRLHQGRDFEIEEKRKNISLTEEGIKNIENILGINNLYSPENNVLSHFAENAIRAEFVYEKNREYVLQNNQIIIVDEFTGRLMTGRRFSDGLHQALEAKENVSIQRESITYATITLQNYFRMYKKLSGMTGTASTEAEEMEKIYGLEVIEVPTNKESLRVDHGDYIYINENAKWNAIVEKVSELNKDSRPVLIGTTTIEKSEHLSKLLSKRNISHNVLNAKFHEKEAQIIEEAGIPGAVTVATNMAGRGTDIILGGKPKTDEQVDDDWEKNHNFVVENGGLFVIGTERHESRRIDNQLRGRCGRQGDPGETQFYLSTEDEIVKRFGGDRIKGAMNLLRWEDDIPIENRIVSKSVETAQTKVEAQNFEIRKYLVDYDDVMNTQRDVIYKLRDQALSGENIKDLLLNYIHEEIDLIINNHNEIDSSFYRDITKIIPKDEFAEEEINDYIDSQIDLKQSLYEFTEKLYISRIENIGDSIISEFSKAVLLKSLDENWVEHLTSMDSMRQGIGLEAAGQRDPLVAYKRTGYAMFQNLNDTIRSSVSMLFFHASAAYASGNQGKISKFSNEPSVMSNAKNNEQSSHVSSLSNIPTHSSNGRKLSRSERRKIERDQRKNKK
ncbi:MAG: preprotein translocase subunit SecA [Chloroflexi bacterium]|nr:preprotein translocase subunit SecA [Chloroflexota bacterium]